MDEDGRREETPKERDDRELIELLNELRVALPGVQVMFAFMLAVPFSKGYSKVTHFEKLAFFVALVATALSSALLIATPSIHRLLFRHRDKERIVLAGNRLAIAGIAFLGVAMVASVLMVSDFLFGRTTGYVTAGVLAAVVLAAWYGFALRVRLTD